MRMVIKALSWAKDIGRNVLMVLLLLLVAVLLILCAFLFLICWAAATMGCLFVYVVNLLLAIGHIGEGWKKLQEKESET